MASRIRSFHDVARHRPVPRQPVHRVCLVGAGNVSHTHAEALETIAGAEIVAVCDTQPGRARSLAERHGADHVFAALDEALASRTFDFAHVLLPPDRHIPAAAQLVEAGIGVLLEKPMGVSRGDCDALVIAARERCVPLGVNHNAVFYPAYLELRQAITGKSLGPLQHVIVVLNFPKRTLGSPAHWMLQDPKNLAYESGIHPFSQIYDLAGPVMSARTTVSGRHELGQLRCFFDTWQVSLVCQRATAQLFLSYGGSYRTWQIVAICQDGVLTAEVEQNRLTALDRTRWGRYHEPLHLARKVAVQELGKGVQNLAREADAVLRPTPRKDTYFESMRASIESFHHALAAAEPRVDGSRAVNGASATSGNADLRGSVRPQVDGAFGAQVVGICEAAIEVSATPLMLKGTFAKSGTSRSYSTEPTVPPLASCAATRS